MPARAGSSSGSTFPTARGPLGAVASRIGAAGGDVDALAAELCRRAIRILEVEWAELATADGGMLAREGALEAVAHLERCPLRDTPAVLSVGRARVAIRPRERRLLAALAELAATRWRELARPVPRVDEA